MRIIHYEAEKRYVDAGMLLCTVFLLYRKLLSCKVKNAPRGCASRGEEVSCKQHRSSAKESQATLCSVV